MNNKILVKILFLLFVASIALTSCSPNPSTPAKAMDTPTATATALPPTLTPTFTPPPATSTHTLVPPRPTPTLGIGSTQVSTKDGMTLMYVPAGNFLMGSSDVDVSNYLKLFSGSSKDWFINEQPQHTVYLDAFWIDQTEVTNTQYAQCVNAGMCKAPHYSESYTHSPYYGNSSFGNYPVIYMDWNMANAYCQWAGRELPSEAQWEKAARGTDGRMYPWGNDAPDLNKMNFNNNVGDTTAVGSYPSGASPYGALDMAGNVWEWVADWYDSTYYGKSPAINPTVPSSGQYRVLRGGSWSNDSYYARAANRDITGPPGGISYNFGFRCAATEGTLFHHVS